MWTIYIKVKFNFLSPFYKVYIFQNKIPFLDIYGDINLVGHVIKSYKVPISLQAYRIIFITDLLQYKYELVFFKFGFACLSSITGPIPIPFSHPFTIFKY